MDRRTTILAVCGLIVVAVSLTVAAVLIVHMVVPMPRKPEIAPPRIIEPALRQYDQTLRFDVGLDDPTDIAAGADGRIYAASGRTIRTFSRDGKPLPKPDWTLAEPATCLAADGEKVYVGNKAGVTVHDSDGKVLQTFAGPDEGMSVVSIAVGEDRVYVAAASSSKRVVSIRTLDGTPTGQIVLGEGQAFRAIHPLIDLAVGPDGKLRVANGDTLQVQIFEPDGKLAYAWGKASFDLDGFCGCCNPVSLAVLPDGRVATSEKGLPTVKVFHDDRTDRRGRIESVVAAPEDFQNPDCLLRLAVDSDGRILVLDPAARQVRVYQRKAQ